MACGDDLKTLLSRHVDGELSPDERGRVEEHLVACSDCREMLELFRKNESILSNALATESFGNAVIESVISEIKREGLPPEAKPVEESLFETLRARPFLPLAAAALFIVGLVGILTYSHDRQITALRTRLEGQIQTMNTRQQQQTEIIAKTGDEYERLIRTLRTEDALHRAPPGFVLAFMDTPHHLVIRANFDPKQFGSYTVYRRVEGEGDDRFAKVSGDRRLESPEYVDTSVKRGSAYVYKFRAFRSAREDDFTESLPIVMRVPKSQELAPEKSIRIQCVDIAVNRKLAKFLLHRVVGGRTVAEEFLVKPGEAVGDVREVPGFGAVNFRTGLTLDRLDDGNQTLPVSYTSAQLDAEGKPVIKSFEGGTVEPATLQQEGVLSIRPNLRAFFRSSGAADVDLWKGSWLQVRAQD